MVEAATQYNLTDLGFLPSGDCSFVTGTTVSRNLHCGYIASALDIFIIVSLILPRLKGNLFYNIVGAINGAKDFK